MKKYKSDEEVLNVLRRFENCEYAREEWRHADHLIVGLFYVLQNKNTAHDRMRDGIFRLLQSFGVDLAKEMPYHETLTVFWLKTIAEFAAAQNSESLCETANELIETFDKSYPFNFYSRELLFSDEARKNYILPDLH